MRGRLDEVRAAGADLVFVGCGTPAHAASFQRGHVPECSALTDPTLEAHRRLGLRRSVFAALGPKSVLAGARATLRGHPQTWRRGDPWQQGGLFAVVPGGELVFAQRNSDASDRPDLDGALTALRRWRESRRAAS